MDHRSRDWTNNNSVVPDVHSYHRSGTKVKTKNCATNTRRGWPLCTESSTGVAGVASTRWSWKGTSFTARVWWLLNSKSTSKIFYNGIVSDEKDARVKTASKFDDRPARMIPTFSAFRTTDPNYSSNTQVFLILVIYSLTVITPFLIEWSSCLIRDRLAPVA